MSGNQPNNPLHGVKLEQIVTELSEHFGWQGLADRIAINCFRSDPSVKSSLKFLRKTQWARDKVEALYLETFFGTAQKPVRKQAPQRTENTTKIDPWKNLRKS